MKILFIGDIVGEVGRRMLSEHLKSLQNEYSIDLTIVNGENAAHGKGITPKIYDSFKSLGVDVITLGNHAFSKNIIKEYMEKFDDLVRPCNMEPLEYGRGFVTCHINNLDIMIINICGKAFMDNILNKVIAIEDSNGNTIMAISIDENGKIVDFDNCNIADVDNDIVFGTNKDMIRLQMD